VSKSVRPSVRPSVHNQTEWRQITNSGMDRGRWDIHNDITFKLVQGRGQRRDSDTMDYYLEQHEPFFWNLLSFRFYSPSNFALTTFWRYVWRVVSRPQSRVAASKWYRLRENNMVYHDHTAARPYYLPRGYHVSRNLASTAPGVVGVTDFKSSWNPRYHIN